MYISVSLDYFNFFIQPEDGPGVDILNALVDSGLSGKTAGSGFYVYSMCVDIFLSLTTDDLRIEHVLVWTLLMQIKGVKAA